MLLFSGLAVQYCEHNFDFPGETSVFCEMLNVLCCFLCEIFDRELRFEETRLVD